MRVIALLAILFIFTPFLCFSAQPLNVIINEIAWMGTEVSANDEWIELYNQGDGIISLDGWRLTAQDGTPSINLKGTIKPKGFFILERTNNETLPTVPADLIYTGALKNTGEFLQLKDGEGNLIDEVNCQQKWLAGNNQTKQTMERTGSGLEWQTSDKPGGTPKLSNSQPPTLRSPTSEKAPEVGPSENLEKSAEIVSSQSTTQNFQNEIGSHSGAGVFAIGLSFSFVSAALLLIFKRILNKKVID